MNVDYGALDGTTIPWHHYMKTAALNTLIWLLLVLLPFILLLFLPSLWEKIVKLLSLFLVAIQAIAIISILPSTNWTYNTPAYGFSAFASSTFPPLTVLATGHIYDFLRPYNNFLAEAWTSPTADAFYGRLHEAGYKTSLFVNPARILWQGEGLEGKIDNLVEQDRRVQYTLFGTKLLQFSAFRYAPHVVKPTFWMTTSDLSGIVPSGYSISNSSFFDEIRGTGLSAENAKRQFILYHLSGAHPPFDMDAQALPKEGADAIEEARGCLYMMEEYIRQMKVLGIYDNTAIIITADHGVYRPEPFPSTLLMIKERDGKGDTLSISQAPVAQVDLLPTLLSLAGLPYADLGPSALDLPEDMQRERVYYARSNNSSYPTIDGANNVYNEYRFTGHVNDIDATLITGVVPLKDSYYK